jgi:hypothetical protein
MLRCSCTADARTYHSLLNLSSALSPFVIPKDAAELDIGVHNFPSTPQKAQKEQMCFKKCLRSLPAGIQTGRHSVNSL